MKLCNKLLILTVLCASLFSCSADKGTVLPTGTGPTGWYIDPRLDQLWLDIKAGEEGFDTQQYFEFLLEACELDWDQEYLNFVLHKASDAQVREEGHINFGQIPRFLGDDISSPKFDQNCIEFAVEFASLVRTLYYDKLDAAAQALLDEFLDYAIYAIYSHSNVATSYTNIYLMRMWNLIALGECLPSERSWGRSLNLTPAQIAEAGYEMFRSWIAEIKQYGIHEHNSPTYAGVQAECLGYIARYCKDPEIKRQAGVALEYMSAMLFSNYFTPSMSLAGVQSRCYYRGSSNGKVDNIMGGLIKGYDTYFFNSLAIWEPTEQARELNALYPRLVAYRWGEDPDMNAIAYYHPKYVIASSGRPYTGNANEKNLTVFLSSERHKSMVNFSHYLDGRNDPYGKAKLSNGVARHLQKYAMGRAQRDNEFVAMIAGDGSERDDTQKLCSHIVIPATNVDEMWNGDTHIANFLGTSSKSLSAEDNFSFFLRFEDVVVSVRYLYTEDSAGKSATPSLNGDSDGSANFTQGIAMRLSTTLSSATPAKWSLPKIAMWWRVDDGIDSDEKFAALRKSVIEAPCSISASKESFSLSLSSPDGELGFSGDYIRAPYKQYITLDEQSSTLYWAFDQKTTTGGADAQNTLLSVNGSEIGQEILSKL